MTSCLLSLSVPVGYHYFHTILLFKGSIAILTMMLQTTDHYTYRTIFNRLHLQTNTAKTSFSMTYVVTQDLVS